MDISRIYIYIFNISHKSHIYVYYKKYEYVAIVEQKKDRE